MNGEVTQPPSTEGSLPDAASTYRRRTLAHDAVSVGSIVAVGASWRFMPETVDMSDSNLLAVLVLMTAALAAIFGASISAVRDFVARAALAAVVACVVVLTFDVTRPDYSGYVVLALWLFAFGMLIVVTLAWLVGVVIGWRWCHVAGR